MDEIGARVFFYGVGLENSHYCLKVSYLTRLGCFLLHGSLANEDKILSLKGFLFCFDLFHSAPFNDCWPLPFQVWDLG